jgi:hypothetical protein
MSHGFTRFFTEMGHGITPFFTVLRWGALGLILVGCSGGLTPEEAASLAAKGYYRHLADGDCEHFLEGRVGSDSLPELYREQLLTSCRQFVAQQKKLHQGITDVSVSNVRRDTLTDYVSVFLLLKFGDATTEEIVVPMVEHNGKWRMK